MQTPSNPLPLIRWSCAALVGLALSLASVQAADVAVDIQCSPSVVMLRSVAAGDWMTVHANLPYSKVDRTVEVQLNGLPAKLLKADNRGNLVAKFDLTQLKTQLQPGFVNMTLTGATVTGDVFTGSDTVRVLAAPRLQTGAQAGPKADPAQSRTGPCDLE
jgi:hypothetical protein